MTTATDSPARGFDPAAVEARGLRLSAAAGLALAVVGIGWGLLASSQVILFDGVYAILGFALSWLGIRAAALVRPVRRRGTRSAGRRSRRSSSASRRWCCSAHSATPASTPSWS